MKKNNVILLAAEEIDSILGGSCNCYCRPNILAIEKLSDEEACKRFCGNPPPDPFLGSPYCVPNLDISFNAGPVRIDICSIQ
jgi:hypothetical protein